MIYLYALLGGWLGLTSADIDLAPPLPISHRSAWTHGPFIPILLCLATLRWPWLSWFAVGFLPAYALHLCYDMFPKRWLSIAKISLVPIPFRLPGLLSFLYLWFSAMVSFSAVFLIISTLEQLIVGVAVSLVFGIKYAKKENGTLPAPFSWLLGKSGDIGPLVLYINTLAGGFIFLFLFAKIGEF